MQRTRHDEKFLSRLTGLADESLPYKLQKKQLLERLGFPMDRQCKRVRADDKHLVLTMLEEYGARYGAFVIIVSEKRMRSWVTPFFIVNGAEVVFRDINLSYSRISQIEILEKVAAFGSGSWLEFALPLWGEDVYAARVMYHDQEKQTLEIQQGVDPRTIGNDQQNPFFAGEMTCFRCSDYNYFRMEVVRPAGFRATVHRDTVEEFAASLSVYASGFEALRRISAYPTLEFAFRRPRQVLCVDVDWPRQWIPFRER